LKVSFRVSNVFAGLLFLQLCGTVELETGTVLGRKRAEVAFISVGQSGGTRNGGTTMFKKTASWL
jgi:hypothetical protein